MLRSSSLLILYQNHERLFSHWILPQRYRIEVTLPDVASPADYEVELWDGSFVALTSTHQVFEKTFTPTPEGGAYTLPAAVMLAVDPTVQVAGDVETPVAGHWLKSIGEQTKDLLNSTVEEIKTEFRNKHRPRN